MIHIHDDHTERFHIIIVTIKLGRHERTSRKFVGYLRMEKQLRGQKNVLSEGPQVSLCVGRL